MLFRPGLTRIPFRANDASRSGGRRLQRIELDLARDRHAQAAIEAYADSCSVEMPRLAGVLREAVSGGQDSLTRCSSTVLRAFDLAHAWAATQPDYAGAAWDHVRVHLGAAFARRPAADENEEGDEQEVSGPRVTAGNGFPLEDGQQNGQLQGQLAGQLPGQTPGKTGVG